MSVAYRESIDRPSPLLQTDRVEDLAKHLANKKFRYSLQKVIRELSAAPARVSGYEHEISQELQHLDPSRRNTGTLVPLEAFGALQRDLTLGTLPGLVQTSVSPDAPISFLRVKSVCGRCGATLLEGLTGGNLSLPRATGTAGAGWYGELGPIPSADQNLDNITLSPKLIAGSTIVSNQLLQQSSPSIESFVVRDISDAIAIAIDQAALFGVGSAMVPKGLMTYAPNAPGSFVYGLRAPSVTFGAAADWNHVLQFEKNLEDARIENDGTFAFVSSPATRTKWQAASKGGSFPLYLWEQESDSLDGVVNGRRAVSSAQITGDIVIAGKFSEMLIASWLGVEITVNRHTRAINAETVIQATLLADVGFRYTSAFCASTDSGAQ